MCLSFVALHDSMGRICIYPGRMGKVTILFLFLAPSAGEYARFGRDDGK